MLNIAAVRILEVFAQPPITAALPPIVAAQGPCALLEPNSLTGLEVLLVTLLAFVAIAIWWFIMQSIGVSSTCASMIGASTVMIGSFGKAISPSLIA